MTKKLITGFLYVLFAFGSFGVYAAPFELLCKYEQSGDVVSLKIDIEKMVAYFPKSHIHTIVGNVEKFIKIKSNDVDYEGGWTMIIDRNTGDFFSATTTTLYGKVWGYTHKGTCNRKMF